MPVDPPDPAAPRRFPRARTRVLLGVVLAATAVAVAGPVGAFDSVPVVPVPPDGASSTRCDAVAAKNGSDRAPGTLERPVRSVRRLVEILPGAGTGCLRAGRWREDVRLARPRVTLRSFPGERAAIRGRFWVVRSATGAQVTDLALDGRSASGLPSPTVNADRVTFARNDVTNRHTAICFVLGSEGYGDPTGTVLSRNRIHACGRLPSHNQDHGIYVSGADRTSIVDNVIYDNADRGIQLYPHARRTVITGNILDANGEGIIFSGAGRTTSSSNTIVGNVIAHSRIRADVESYYSPGTPRGRGNVVHGNCLFGGRGGTVAGSPEGFRAFENVEADPQFADARAGDFRVRGAACAVMVAASRAPAGPHGEPPVGP